MLQNLYHSMDSFLLWLWTATWQASLVIGLVALVQAALHKQLPAKWRHGLWLFVIIRLALPASIESRWSLFNWVTPELTRQSATESARGVLTAASAGNETLAYQPEARFFGAKRWWRAIEYVWLLGAGLLAARLVLVTSRLTGVIRRKRPVTDGEVLNLLEDCKLQMGVHVPISLHETKSVSSPCLLGWIRPRLLLPDGLIKAFSPAELRCVFLHELGHVKRLDIPLNWGMSLALVLHWFNPLVWFAFKRLGTDRELACDALVLSRSREPDRRLYGQTIIKLLERFSRPFSAPGLLGILETQNQMKRRISMIAKFRNTNSWPLVPATISTLMAILTLTNARSGQTEAPGPTVSATPEPGAPPRIVASVPLSGDTDVDPALNEVSVTFDRDMERGFSFTGGGPEFPGREGVQARWKDKRTCILPVNVESAHFYRVGINAPSFHNFRSVEGAAAVPTAILFTTKGATDEMKRKATRPMVVGLTPKNGARDVDPKLTELRVTFNVPMGGGFSWTGSGPEFPPNPEGKKPYWTEDHKTCVLPVQLSPSSNYRLGLNSPSFKNFRSQSGVPLDPIVYTFKTKE